jgi:hypothetical protein
MLKHSARFDRSISDHRIRRPPGSGILIRLTIAGFLETEAFNFNIIFEMAEPYKKV